MRAHDLTGDADIGKARVSTQSKWSRRAVCKKPLISRKTLSRPMLAPSLDGFGVGAKCFGEVIADARRHQGMRIGDRHEPQRARIGALLGVLRYQRRAGL